jgi:serine phosphatase RsbU (regulator of sigma subunit)
VLEVRNNKLNEFGRSRLKRSFLIYANSGKKSKQILNKFYQEIVCFADNQQFDDDVTLLIVERSI